MQINNIESNNYKFAFSGHSFTLTPEVAKTIREIRNKPSQFNRGLLADLREALNGNFWDNPFDRILNVHITKIIQQPDEGAVVDVYLHTKRDRVIQSSLIIPNNLDIYDSRYDKLDDYAAHSLLKHEKQKEPFWIKMRAKFIQNKNTQKSHYEFEPRD